MEPIRVLLVDDDQATLEITHAALESRKFHVTSVEGLTDALRQIARNNFDVLLTDQHMPSPADGFTLASVMRIAQPSAVTILASGMPDPQSAKDAMVGHVDEILAKPVDFSRLADLIRKRVTGHRRSTCPPKVTVATILEGQSELIIADWLARSKEDPNLKAVQLGDKDRIGHLPGIVRDLVARLRMSASLGEFAQISPAAAAHGVTRHTQGYSVEMIVDESRLLQVSIFHELHNNLHRVDPSNLLIDVMTIADEVDSQLRQCVGGYVDHAKKMPSA